MMDNDNNEKGHTMGACPNSELEHQTCPLPVLELVERFARGVSTDFALNGAPQLEEDPESGAEAFVVEFKYTGPDETRQAARNNLFTAFVPFGQYVLRQHNFNLVPVVL